MEFVGEDLLRELTLRLSPDVTVLPHQL
jgi:hypothetical protein